MSHSINDMQGCLRESGNHLGASSDADNLYYSTQVPPSFSGAQERECPLCALSLPESSFPEMSCCDHRSCQFCLVMYLQTEIEESRVVISCPECEALLHSTKDIHSLLLDHPSLIDKYEDFSLRRVLISDPYTRWCPAPNCHYAVIATGCTACPLLQCESPGCGTRFCYLCKAVWHPNRTCDEARAEEETFDAHFVFDKSMKPGYIKACPRCRTYITKMNDGSCNHITCSVCGVEFCWLCMEEISDVSLHYSGSSDCTMFGKKPWTLKKKFLLTLATVFGAPIAITLTAWLAIPVIMIGFPALVGKKVYQKMMPGQRRRVLVTGSVVGSLLLSPVVVAVVVGVGVPLLLVYAFGVIPVCFCLNRTRALTDLVDIVIAVAEAEGHR